MDHPGIWGTWSQFLELPFSNYLPALTARTFVSGGTGAEVRKDSVSNPVDCTIHHRHRNQSCALLEKREPACLFLCGSPRAAPRASRHYAQTAAGIYAHLQHMYMHRASWEQHPILRPPTLASSSSIPSAERPCASLKISWGFHSFSFKGHDYQGGEGTLRILAHAFEFFSTLPPFLVPILYDIYL